MKIDYRNIKTLWLIELEVSSRGNLIKKKEREICRFKRLCHEAKLRQLLPMQVSKLHGISSSG